MDLEKRILALEKKIAELESKNLEMFGRSYSQLGNSNSDTLIKTRGQVKIQWGNKFIDLIKDGKINTDIKFIYNQDSIGSKEGIYIVDDKVWLVSGDKQIDLGGTGTTYVSFLEPQETTAENKYQALTNIGLIYTDISQLNENSLQNGIIYVESEKKLYIVQNGQTEAFVVNVPNPFTEQFLIQKSDSTKGALVIKGKGINNSIAFDNLFIYNDSDSSIINSSKDLLFKIQDQNVARFSPNQASFLSTIIGNRLESVNASSDYGFKLYMQEGKSILEVDQIIVREPDATTHELLTLFPFYLIGDTAVIAKVEKPMITFNQRCDFQVGDTLCAFAPNKEDVEITKEIKPEDLGPGVSITEEMKERQTTSVIKMEDIRLKVKERYIDAEKETVKIKVDIVNDEGLSIIDSFNFDSLLGKVVFRYGSDNNTYNPIEIQENTISVKNSDRSKILSRIGKIEDDEVELRGTGIDTNHLVIKGEIVKHFAIYTYHLNNILTDLDVIGSKQYDNVIPTIGVIKKCLSTIWDQLQEIALWQSTVNARLEKLDPTPTTPPESGDNPES